MSVAFCYRRSGPDHRLRGAPCICDLHEYLFFRTLSHDLLSAAAVQCGDADEERHVSDCIICDIFSLLSGHAASHTDRHIWPFDDRILHRVLYSGLLSGLQACAADLPAEEINTAV